MTLMHKILSSFGLEFVCCLILLTGCLPATRAVQSNRPVVVATAGPLINTTLVQLEAPTAPPQQFTGLELRLTTPLTVTNPFDPGEADAWVRFVHARGTLRVPVFSMGQAGWRARFTPPYAGPWTAQAEWRRGTTWVASAPVSFIAAPASTSSGLPRGFVRVHPQNTGYLAFENGQTFLPIGLNLGWWRDNAVSDYRRWFDALQANGGTVARIWMASWSFGLEWNDTGLGDYSRRMDRAAALDEVVRMAEARGIYLIIVLLNHGAFSLTTNSEWASNPYNAALGGPNASPRDFVTDATSRALFQRRLRYIAARWAYSPHVLAWEWWNEVELTAIDTRVLQPWITEMTAALRQFDPYQHLTTISYAGDGDPAIWGMPEIDLLQRHEYSLGEPKWFKPVPNLNTLQRIPANIHKPFLFGELGASPAGETDTPAGRLGIHLHNGLWASVFNGYASTAMYWWWDSLVEPANLWPHYNGLATFLRNEDLATLKPMTATVSTADIPKFPFAIALVRGTPEHALIWLRNIAYTYDAASTRYMITQSTGEDFKFEIKPQTGLTLNVAGLRDGIYHVRWFDTLTGALVTESSAISQNGVLSTAVPDLHTDLAAKVF